jgi:hypothetical protein
MGLTIHYRLELGEADHALARERVEELRRRALQLSFEKVGEIQHLVGDECLSGDDRVRWFGQLNTDDAKHPLVTPKEIIAFSTLPGQGCESAGFGLRKWGDYGYSWEAYCKTAYTAGDGLNFLRCHLSIIAILDHAQELGLLRWVDDEGGYWEHRDWLELLLQVRNRASVHGDLQTVEKQIIDWFGPFGPVKLVSEKVPFVLIEE